MADEETRNTTLVAVVALVIVTLLVYFFFFTGSAINPQADNEVGKMEVQENFQSSDPLD